MNVIESVLKKSSECFLILLQVWFRIKVDLTNLSLCDGVKFSPAGLVFLFFFRLLFTKTDQELRRFVSMRHTTVLLIGLGRRSEIVC